MSAEELIREYFGKRNPKFEKSNYFNEKLRKREERSWAIREDIALSFEEFTKWDYMLSPLIDFIPERLHNKKIRIGEYEMIIQFSHAHVRRTDNFGDEFRGDKRPEAYGQNKVLNIIVCHRGLYHLIGKYREYYLVVGENYVDGYKPSMLKFRDKNKPYRLTSRDYQQEFEYYEGLDKIIQAIELNNVEVEDSHIAIQDWYYFENSKTKTDLRTYSQKEIDYEWFVNNETKDGVFKPEKATIDNIYSSYEPNYNILIDLGIHTVQLRSNCHFDIKRNFNLDGIIVKAPKSVIEAYDLEKYCKDENTLKEIKNDKKKKDMENKARELNNQFTLIQHGKVLFENQPKHIVMDYLENHEAEDVEAQILKNVRPVFDNYPVVDKFYIGWWGQHWENELRGEDKEFSNEVDKFNEKHIDAETLREINELYEGQVYCWLSDRVIRTLYGWPTLEYTRLGVRRSGKKLEIFTEDFHE